MTVSPLASQKIGDAQHILKDLGLPLAQQNEISALTLLALCGIKPADEWATTSQRSLTVSKGIMAFIADEYHKPYAPNTRETVRRQVLHQFCQAQIADYNPDDAGLPTNSPRAHYALSERAACAIRKYGTEEWEAAVREFLAACGNLAEIYRQQRTATLIPVVLSDDTRVLLSPGRHNQVQAAVITEFAPRFAGGAKVLYLGDTANKGLYFDANALRQAGVPVTEHDKLPDIILYDEQKRWLFLIEVVTSHGPMSPKRLFELEEMLRGCPAEKVFVTAFPDFAEFRRHSRDIAWETEVWLAEIPDHMIHYNGDKFFGPRTGLM